jgi:hypothetical protein
MESPSSPTVESSTILNLHHHLSENSNRLFSMIYPFKLTQHQQHYGPVAALISPDSHSGHTVLTAGGSLTSPVLVTKHTLSSIVNYPGEGDSSSTATATASKSHYIHPAPIVPKPTQGTCSHKFGQDALYTCNSNLSGLIQLSLFTLSPVLELPGIPLPEMPVFPSYQPYSNAGGGASMEGATTSSVTSATNLPAVLGDHHHPAPDGGPVRLNKFVRRLHDMLMAEKDSGVVEWRRGLLVLYSTDAFSKRILPKYFNTRNFKTFRRQLNYYGFVHVRSFSATGNTTTALWINQELARDDANNDISAVLKLRRVEPCETAKTVEGRRQRKELALHTVEEDIGLNSKKLQLDQIRFMAIRGEDYCGIGQSMVQREQKHIPEGIEYQLSISGLVSSSADEGIPREVHVPTDSEESNHHSDSCGEEESTGSPSPIASPTTKTEREASMLQRNMNTAAANMLLMLARS